MRLEITQRADLAVRALVVLARSPERLKSADLSDALGTTPGFVPQVMGPLVRAGWVRSDPGPTGGYQLTADLDKLSVLQVIEEIDGPTESGRCVVTPGLCAARQPCSLHFAWATARHELTRSLDSMSVAAAAVHA
jgi:Rrf2 family transcriptional regulator, iron-sulfur cluster assembly transcription factor